ELLEGCTFGQPGDPCLDEWDLEYGPYESNGSVVAIVRSSSVAADEPDLIIFGLPGDFRGYYPGYSDDAISRHNRFTWAVLKAHTRNQRGSVTLRSADPRDRPDIRFRYFEGTVGDDLDMQAMVEGVEFVRRINGQYNELASSSEAMVEVYPGPEVGSSEEIATYVRDQSWGHHACCTAPMGADDDPMAVLDSRFRVRGVERLRVVDASVFPEIPGFFIVTPIYMASEKASDVILEDAER
ncbi:MAG: GMC family oxidoreductase, partial [Acidobacteriota bacterium]